MRSLRRCCRLSPEFHRQFPDRRSRRTNNAAESRPGRFAGHRAKRPNRLPENLYVIVGRVVEKVTGEPYEQFLDANILRTVGISDVTWADHPGEPERNAIGYYRFALGPPRRAPFTDRNWLFAMSDLEMTAKDLALWDISVLHRSLLSAPSYEVMSSDTKISSGRSTGYGLGFFGRTIAGTDEAALNTTLSRWSTSSVDSKSPNTISQTARLSSSSSTTNRRTG